MRDPHVVSLHYRLETSPTTSFRNPSPASQETSDFKMLLSDGIATFELTSHYPSEEEARKPVDNFLRAWEFDADLTLGRGEIRFVFEKSHIIDREPPPAGSYQISAKAGSIGLSFAIASAHVSRSNYPFPPHGIKISPDVQVLWFCYQLYLEEHEQLSSMGYFCLSVIENKFKGKGRGKVEKEYNIDISVLNKLGMLTSAVGNYQTARKIDKNHTLRPYTNQEIRWIEEAVKKLIRRVAEYDFDPQASQKLPLITMADLPLL